MKVYNTNLIDNKKRWQQAVIVGIIATILSSILYSFIVNILGSFSGILFVLNAYIISNGIKRYGKGIGPKYATLGVVCTVVSIFLSQWFVYYGLNPLNFLNIPLLFNGTIFILRSLFNLSNIISLLFNIVFIGIAIQYAQSNSSIL